MVDIYNFTNPNDFIRTCWEEKKSSNPHFSIRAWSRQLNLPTHTIIYEIIQGKRTVPISYIPIISKNLKLDTEELTYFEALVSHQRAKTELEKSFYQDRIQTIIKQVKVKFYQLQECQFFEDPLHMIILEMTSLKEFRNDVQWIQKKLRINKSTDEIENALSTLYDLKLLCHDSNNMPQKTNQYISTPDDTFHIYIQNAHKNMLAIASEQITEQSIDQREFGTYMMNINKDSIPKAKKLIRDFIKFFMANIESDPFQGHDTYNLGVQFFAITDCQKDFQ